MTISECPECKTHSVTIKVMHILERDYGPNGELLRSQIVEQKKAPLVALCTCCWSVRGIVRINPHGQLESFQEIKAAGELATDKS